MRTRTRSDVKWLVNEAAALSGELQRLDALIAELSSKREAVQKAHDACTTTLAYVTKRRKETLGLPRVLPQRPYSGWDPLILKEGLLVGFFLAGLVVLGGMQQWWLQPIVSSLEPTAMFFGALGLTAITDNAALTYLGSLIEGMTDQAKYMLVAGAVAGGGLTVIANAPNPAGVALLRDGFNDGAIGIGGLLAGAILPTAVAAIFFLL